MANDSAPVLPTPSLSPSFEIQIPDLQATTSTSAPATTSPSTPTLVPTTTTSTSITRAAVDGCPFGIDHNALGHAHLLDDCVIAAAFKRPPPQPASPPTRLSDTTTTAHPTDRFSNTDFHACSSPLRTREGYSGTSTPSSYNRPPLPQDSLSNAQSPSFGGQQHSQGTVMRGTVPTMAPIATSYRALEQEGDSLSSSSNSPARQDYDESDFYAGNNDSQSSIGVPTFRDMAVSGEVCEPPANLLPAEVLIGIFSKLNTPGELFNAMLVSKRWARNCVDLLWHRPSCVSWPKHSQICKTLSLPDPTFTYRDFIKRLNLAALADGVNDGSVVPLSVCSRVERLTLTACSGLTDAGLIGLLTDSRNLLALDISGDTQITSESMIVLADNCKRLQGLNIGGCQKITTESMIAVANSCRHIKRVGFILEKPIFFILIIR